MSDLSMDVRDVSLESVEEAKRLLELAQSQHGGAKRLTEGRRYLVITREYIEHYGELFAEEERRRLIAKYSEFRLHS
jgi:hypothetical protein